ncbi:hypothetical protein [Qipengyuania atrilutea]|uniref:TnsA endonuclease N-terminal domain-containing protein n=1 Tax=Qipengyuania atrilutea TaxID=2744473 RepID=A0A850GZN9_9SPHN|nr:hypothetical protein [Actirhodobacter atriluteus]NVD45101.1 hypothetical protein [Actirhodobacter atriluteus]
MKIKQKCPGRSDVVQPTLAPTPSGMYPPPARYVREPKPDKADVRIVRATDGGALRTFNGGLAHENGWLASKKAGRLLHYEGIAQRDFLVRAEVEPGVANMASEAVRFEFIGPNGKEIYTADVELTAPDGTITIVEIKRDRRDLSDPAYRDKLARVKQICDERGMRFRVIFEDQIWLSIVHRRNVTHFASRAFTTIRPEHRHRFEKHCSKTDGFTTFGDLADAIEPGNRRYAEAIVQALTVARKVEIDLSRPLFDTTEVTLH